jgi:hypothetical protein
MDGTGIRGFSRGFRIIVSLLVVLVAVVVCAGAFAQWSAASTALPQDIFSSDGVALAGGSVAMDVAEISPGQTVTGAAVVVNSGDAPGRFTFGTGTLADHPGAGGGSLAGALRVSVVDVTGGRHHLVYSGSPTRLSGVDLGAFGPGDARSYRIAVTFPQQTVDAAVFAGSSLTMSLQWTAVTED